jgi:hypothetical protein
VEAVSIFIVCGSTIYVANHYGVLLSRLQIDSEF